MAGVLSILSMGSGALNASSVAINTTGNNISNVNTTGYSRQAVRFSERMGLNSSAGQLGQGVKTEEVYRYFDNFIEAQLLGSLSTASRYTATYNIMSTVETVFNESTVSGISALMLEMFNSWNDLAADPENAAVREALLGTAATFIASLQNADATLEDIQRQLDDLIRQEVEDINTLLEEIARLNNEINAMTVAGSNNANALLDMRDQKVRELAEKIDISVQNDGAGNYTITTSGGNLLVQENIAYSLSYQGPTVESALTANSPYRNSAGSGTIGYSGTDTCEYTIEFVTGGAVDGAAQFRVSLDGGKTWLTDDNGNIQLFAANSEDSGVTVGGLTLWFDAGESLAAGDKFLISPKSDVYWNSPTSGPINISTQIYGDSSENSTRITGGTLAGYLTVRDYMIGEYRDQLDALAQTIIWEVNRLHSQGSGLSDLSYALGTYAVSNENQPLGSSSSGLVWADYLTEGNVTFAIYDSVTGETVLPYPGVSVFSPDNFDPSKHSLQDVVDAINNGDAGAYLQAGIVDGKLEITTTGDYTFGITSDTTGLAAALGINTFFKGDSASTIAIRDEVAANTDLICAGRINVAGETSEGDNITAKEIAALINQKLNITVNGKTSSLTLSEFYGALVSRVGSDTAGSYTRALSNSAMATSLLERQEEVTGVSLDEELSNLIRFQASYKAAAKLITTADEMLQTIIGLKQ